MVTDQQVRVLMREVGKGKTIAVAAARAGMSEKTGRKYRKLGKSPSESRAAHLWRTREDPFSEVWEEIRQLLAQSSGLQSTTLMEELQRRYPGRFSEGHLRTLQRKIKRWRATEGPSREVFFPQQHQPGEVCESDFCHLNGLRVTITGQTFEHMLYHFVLTYSNWEAGTICLSESAESLSQGLQNALWELGGVPERHRTDSLSAAVKPVGSKEEFTRSYHALMDHYGLKAEHTGPGCPNENGDVEQRHHRMRVRLEQALLLRGSRDFSDRAEYTRFLSEQFVRANQGRNKRLSEERARLRPLPMRRQEAYQRLLVRVGPSSTIRAKHITYSVPSRLIGEQVEVRVYAEKLELWYAQRRVEEMPRLRGGYHSPAHSINYRHIIDWLLRKPGAFAQYRYRDALFPTSRFRMAYDLLTEPLTQPLTQPLTAPMREQQHEQSENSLDPPMVSGSRHRGATKEYLKLLELAARQSEQGVDDALRVLLDKGEKVTVAAVKELLCSNERIAMPTEIQIDAVDLGRYDRLISEDTTAQDTAALKAAVDSISSATTSLGIAQAPHA